MGKRFIKDFWHGLCSFRTGIGVYFSALANILSWLLPKFNLGKEMNAIIAAISLPYRLLILLSGLLVSTILTSYSLYKKHQEKIEEQQQKINELSGGKDMKQEIRNFLESIDPTILQRIDAKEKEIFIRTNSHQSNKLMQLSEHSDFDEFLSFEEEKSGVIFSSRQGIITGYHLYPKDALIK